MDKSQLDLNQVPEEDDENRLVGDNRARMGEEIQICKKPHWTPHEDEKLKKIVLQNGPYNWKLIASKIEGRSGISCRSRWFNYLDSRVNVRRFSKIEENELILAQEMLGNKWALIARQFPGRTDISLKNCWHKLMARMDRDNRDNSRLYEQLRRRPSCAPPVFQCPNPGLNESTIPFTQMGAPNPAVTNVGPNNGGNMEGSSSHESVNLPFIDFFGIGN